MSKLQVAIATFSILGATSAVLRADQRDFPFTYEWRQAAKGEAEFEVKNRYRGRDNTFQQQFELEYGVTDRLQIAPYLVFQHNPGGSYKYDGFKLETRYKIGDFKRNAILPGLYLEYARERGGEEEIEGKLILTRYGEDKSNLSFNYIVERKLENNAEFENLYSLGYARELSKSGVRGGFELIHSLTDGTINAGPVLSLRTKDFYVTGGYALNLNSRKGNRPEARVNFEYEF